MKKFDVLLLGIVWISFAASSLVLASSNQGDEFSRAFEHVQSTRGLKVDVLVPEMLTTMFVVDLNPVEQSFDSTLVAAFVKSLSYFFELIFQAQDEYDVSVHKMEVTDQRVSVDQTLSLTTTVSCIFQPKSGQALSDQDMQHVLIHVINRYQSHLVKYMHKQQSDFASIETAFGHSLGYSSSSASQGSDRSVGLIVATVLATLLLIVSLSALWVLYQRQLSNRDGLVSSSIFRRFIRPGQVAPFDPARENLSPFRDKEEIGSAQESHASHESTVRITSQPSERGDSHEHSSPTDEDDGAMETIEFGIPREPRILKSKNAENDYLGFSHRSKNETERSTASRLLSLDVPSLSPSGIFQASEEEEGTLLPHSLSPRSDETIIYYQTENDTPVGSRFEIYAPPGKLGVAIDVVDGHPVVYRVKPGSPLTGFLRKMDRIIEIDGIDTTHMSAADVTNLMVRNMSKRRKITYLRGDAVFT